MNRLVERMDELQRQKKKAFIAYLMAGDLGWETCAELILSMEKGGVSAVELGVPFSDPIADGPVIQAAAARALERGVTLPSIFAFVRRLRERTNLPLLLMGYWNVFLQFGRKRTLQACTEAGVDGLIVADLPPEADPEFFEMAKDRDLCTVLLAGELTSEQRLRRIALACTGFLYYVPQSGVTGQTLRIGAEVRQRIAKIKSMTQTPVCVGIGVKSIEDVRRLAEEADGVIVGSSLVEFLHARRNEKNLVSQAVRFIQELLP